MHIFLISAKYLRVIDSCRKHLRSAPKRRMARVCMQTHVVPGSDVDRDDRWEDNVLF